MITYKYIVFYYLRMLNILINDVHLTYYSKRAIEVDLKIKYIS